MPRATWSGQISFGLVTVPVKLFTAARSHDIRFRQINEETGARVKRERVDAKTGEPVASENIVKGYPTNGSYILIDPDEVDALRPDGDRSIAIEDFVDLADIEPIYYDRPYYLAPDGQGATKPYRLLVEAMERQGKAAVARFVMRSKEHLAVLRTRSGVLLLSTMRYDDEVVEPGDLDVDLGDVEITDRELQMAEQLIESLVTDFDPSAYTDRYQERLRDLIERKAEGDETSIEAVDEGPTAEVVDLMEALEESLRARGEVDEAPEPDALNEMSKSELYELAQEREIPGRSSMNKDELIGALSQHDEVAAAS